MDILTNKFFLIALTFSVYLISRILQKKLKVSLLNPILLSIIVLIAFLMTFKIDYGVYADSCDYIDFWLKPAVVALGVPLYRQLEAIKKQLLPLLAAELAGCIAGVVSVVGVAELLGASKEVVMSLAPKAVTTPIAMEVSGAIGGIPSLTAAVVICTGIFGGMAGFRIIRYTHIKSPIASSLSLGTAAHALGTSAAMEKSYRYGAFSSLGLTLNGLFTSLFTPTILSLMGYEI